ncbi:MAG: zinc ribbon domain-containing protein [Candidatus Aenigmatarchaeota archaeon]
MRRRYINCPCCGNEVDASWTYCPYCGCNLSIKMIFRGLDEGFGFERFDIREFFDDFDRMIKKVFKEMSDFDKDEKYVKGGGISVIIKSGSGKKPKVYIKTFGDYKDLEPKIKEDIKRKIGIEEVEEEKDEVKEVRKVKVTEEPEVKIVRNLERIEIEVSLPDVESSKDIEISELEESIEIRAYAKDKAYFKIISKPKEKSIVEKKFENGKLRIVLE